MFVYLLLHCHRAYHLLFLSMCAGKGAGQSEVPVIERFGFHVPTCCGYLPQVDNSVIKNSAYLNKLGLAKSTCSQKWYYLISLPPQENQWQQDWVAFYSQQRLQHQLNMVEKSYGDREAAELWAKLQVTFFHTPQHK